MGFCGIMARVDRYLCENYPQEYAELIMAHSGSFVIHSDLQEAILQCNSLYSPHWELGSDGFYYGSWDQHSNTSQVLCDRDALLYDIEGDPYCILFDIYREIVSR